MRNYGKLSHIPVLNEIRMRLYTIISFLYTLLMSYIYINSIHLEQLSKITLVQPGKRFFAMDVMRGIAVLGILLMNIPGFATHQFFLFWGDTLAHETTVNGAIVKSSMLLLDGRMRGLFTLLFGAGIMLFIENKRSNSIEIADAYFKRMTWLLIIGMVDSFLLLWRGDVLFEYALCGIFIYVFRNARVRYLLLTSFIILAIFSIMGGKGYYKYRDRSVVYQQVEKQIQAGKTISDEQKKEHESFNEVIGSHYPFSDKHIQNVSKDIADDYMLHRSGYMDIFEKHAEESYEYMSTVFFSIFSESFGTIMLGMALFKLGFFQGRLKKKTYVLIALIGTIVGLALYAIFMKLQVRTQAEFWDTYRWRNFSIIYLNNAGRILSTLGYAAIIILLCYSNALQKILNLFANVGRMALTNYLMQTIMCSLYFFGFGLGHYGEYDAKGLFVFVMIIWLIQITYSNIYLSYFQMGPVEYLWKRLTYGKGFSKRAELVNLKEN